MKRLFSTWALLLGLLLVGSCSKSDDYPEEPAPKPTPDDEQTELTIQITEKDTLLRFSDNETKTIHYAITGDTVNLEVKAEMQNEDGGYTLQINPTSKTAGTVEIQAKTPTDNRVIISASDGRQTVQASIAVAALPFEGQTVQVKTPGTLGKLLADRDLSTLTELRVTGSINAEDIATLNDLPNLSVLDIEDTDLQRFPDEGFGENETLTLIKLPKSLTTIGEDAFMDCTGLTSVTIPNSVTRIRAGAFYGCTSLMSITIPNGVTKIEESAFSECSGLTSITIPEGVTEIGSYAFSECSGLTNVTIPNSVTTIGEAAFSGCTGLTSITIPEGVTEIGDGAFSGCTGLTNITIPESVTTIGRSAFWGCIGLTSITIPEGVTTIEFSAFHGCTGLTNVTIPESVTTIGVGAFSECTGLTSITIPESVTEIESSVFQYCFHLTSVTIPESVTTIKFWAFNGCSGLTQIECKSTTPPQLENDVFYNMSTSNLVLYVPTGCAQAYRTAEGWKDLKFKEIIETEF